MGATIAVQESRQKKPTYSSNINSHSIIKISPTEKNCENESCDGGDGPGIDPCQWLEEPRRVQEGCQEAGQNIQAPRDGQSLQGGSGEGARRVLQGAGATKRLCD